MTAPVDVTSTESKSKSRRALLAGALGGLGAWAASAVGRASPVRADGETMVIGNEYTTAVTRTLVRNQANSNTVMQVESSTGGVGLYAISTTYTAIYGASGSHIGVRGSSATSTGISGESTASIGVEGRSTATDQPAAAGHSSGNSTGVLGYSGALPLPAARAKTGVYGHATQDSGSRGIWGRANAGQGVRGQATSGVGVFAKATTGLALRTAGRTKFSTSGVATIAAGTTSKTVTPGVNVTSGSFVLLTPKAKLGGRDLWFTTNATANTFTIRMSSSRSKNTKVAWLLLG